MSLRNNGRPNLCQFMVPGATGHRSTLLWSLRPSQLRRGPVSRAQRGRPCREGARRLGRREVSLLVGGGGLWGRRRGSPALAGRPGVVAIAFPLVRRQRRQHWAASAMAEARGRGSRGACAGLTG